MKTSDYLQMDTLEFRLYAEPNPLRAGLDGVRPIVEAITQNSNGLLPDHIITRNKRLDFSEENVNRTLRPGLAKASATLSLARSAEPEANYTFSFLGGASTLGLTLWLVVPMSYFEEQDRGAERSRSFVALARALIDACHPSYAFAHSRTDFQLSDDPHKEDPFAPKSVYEVYWLNYYGQEMVESLGRERVLSTPASYQEAASGGVLWLSSPTPIDYASATARDQQAQALNHLVGTPLDEIRERLKARSALLAPVARDWDPDIEDLLELTLSDFPVAQRSERIADLNQYRSPDVSEWLPENEMLPSDAENEEAAIDRYEGVDAERLAALLHEDVPEVMDASPSSLPQLDHYFWRADYAGNFDRDTIEQKLVPAVGAYLGKILVWSLGGRWVPRKKLDETEVVVGNRAWLPFLRAQRLLRSKQSALDYSLTKFYRVCQRHAEESKT